MRGYFNALGQPVTAAVVLHPSVPAEIDLSKVAAGVYYLNVQGAAIGGTQKIVVTH
jgi:hypothetical protein